MGDLRVANWDEFQHYKTGKNAGSPRWLKLYRDLLDSEDWFELDDIQRYHVIGIWMLAARSEGVIKDNPRWVGARINASHPVDLDKLVELGWLDRLDADGAAVPSATGRSPDDGSRNVLGSSYEGPRKALGSSVTARNEGGLGSSYDSPRTVLGQRREEERREEERREHTARVGAGAREGNLVRDTLAEEGVRPEHLDQAEAMMRAGEAGATSVAPHGMTPSAFEARALAEKLGRALAECFAADPSATGELVADLSSATPSRGLWWKAKSAGWLAVEMQKRQAKRKQTLRPAPPGGVNEWGEPLYDAGGSLAREFSELEP